MAMYGRCKPSNSPTTTTRLQDPLVARDTTFSSWLYSMSCMTRWVAERVYTVFAISCCRSSLFILFLLICAGLPPRARGRTVSCLVSDPLLLHATRLFMMDATCIFILAYAWMPFVDPIYFIIGVLFIWVGRLVDVSDLSLSLSLSDTGYTSALQSPTTVSSFLILFSNLFPIQ